MTERTMKPRCPVNPFIDLTEERKRKFDLLPKRPGALEHQLAVLSMILGGGTASGIETRQGGDGEAAPSRSDESPAEGDAQ